MTSLSTQKSLVLDLGSFQILYTLQIRTSGKKPRIAMSLDYEHSLPIPSFILSENWFLPVNPSPIFLSWCDENLGRKERNGSKVLLISLPALHWDFSATCSKCPNYKYQCYTFENSCFICFFFVLLVVSTTSLIQPSYLLHFPLLNHLQWLTKFSLCMFCFLFPYSVNFIH